MKNTVEFSIKEIIDIIIKRYVWILLCTLIAAFGMFIISKWFIKPTYTASVQMYVDPNDATSSADLTELTYAQKVVTTYINFLETKVFYKQVIEDSKLSYTIEELKAMTQIQAVNNTEIFQINVTSQSPQDAFILVESMEEVAPALINSIKDKAEVSVVDPGVLPTAPSAPNVLANSLIGGIIGLFLSILVLILWEMFDVNVKSQDELMKKYSIPILGTIPYFSGNKNENLDFAITESYKTLRTNLRFALRKEGCKKILISSSMPKDGKSTTSTNIAITISQTGAKVLLMDCDLRKGRIHNLLKIKNNLGLSDILSNMEESKHVILNTSYENLKVITLGSIPPNPTELLASNEMEELLNKLEKEFDYIIIDTPPVNVVSDSLSLIKLVDGILIVIRQNHTSYPSLANAISKYRFVEAPTLGFVLNGVSQKKSKRKNYGYYYYQNEKR